MNKKPKVLFAVGGTGGHLIPAQTVGDQLKESADLLFAGAGLSTNRYFKKENFAFQDVASASPFKGNPLKTAQELFQGVRQAIHLIKTFQPDLIVGFGSFHSFPLLAGAVLKKIPFFLFESNAIPGKVNKLFSRWAEVTCVQFPHAKKLLKGEAEEVAMPLNCLEKTREEACVYFDLDPKCPILLVFGGSQGARAINQVFCDAASHLAKNTQIIHLAGHQADLEQIRQAYAAHDLRACVKPFEQQMAYAYAAADLAISRSGAGAVAELIAYELPSILIPYPFATDDHQRKNAEIMQEEIGGARVLLEKELNPAKLTSLLQEVEKKQREMKSALQEFKKGRENKKLSDLIWRRLYG